MGLNYTGKITQRMSKCAAWTLHVEYSHMVNDGNFCRNPAVQGSYASEPYCVDRRKSKLPCDSTILPRCRQYRFTRCYCNHNYPRY